MEKVKIPISAILIPYYEDIRKKKSAGWSWKMIIAALKQDIEVTEDIALRLTPRLMPTMYGQLRPHDVAEERKRVLPEIIKYRE
ncbi:hypothetical protein HAP94_03325 [Acidithiobacillus ferrivorans]|jgi:hypothetical protein|nr:hypothetical protein [Acidithiobacillus ferrivorans]